MLGQHLAPWEGELVSRHLQLGGGGREHSCGIWSLFAVLVSSQVASGPGLVHTNVLLLEVTQRDPGNLAVCV